MRRFVLLLLMTVALPLHAWTPGQDGWNQWRGSARDGSVTGAPWPASLAGLRPLWRVPLGKGYASPVLASDRVFVVESTPDGQVAVRALSRSDGGELWAVRWASTTEVPFFAASHGNWVRSTPAWDGTNLYVGDMRETLVAIDGSTGTLRCRLDLPAALGSGVPSFGFASSPLLHGEHLFVQAGSSLLKIQAATGTVLWRTLDGAVDIMSDGAFSSPVVAVLGGREQIVTFTRTVLAGVDADSGAVLWRREVPNFRGMNIVTPLITANGIFLSQYRNGSYMYRFAPGSSSPELAWTSKASGYMSSPVLIDGVAYQHLGNGRLAAIDLEAGAELWRTEPLGEYWSLVRQGARMLALDSEGTLRLLHASRAGYELVDQAEVARTETWGHVAVDGGQVFVRELEGIAAFGWREDASVTDTASALAGR